MHQRHAVQADVGGVGDHAGQRGDQLIRPRGRHPGQLSRHVHEHVAGVDGGQVAPVGGGRAPRAGHRAEGHPAEQAGQQRQRQRLPPYTPQGRRQQASATVIVVPPIPLHCAERNRPRTECSPARAPGCQHTGPGEASIPGPVALALLPQGRRRSSTGTYRVLTVGGVCAYHHDVAAPGGATALAVAPRAGPAGGAGHGDGARGGRGGPPRADGVRPALGQHAARDRDRAAQPARLRLGQGPGPARGRRPQRVPGQRHPVRADLLPGHERRVPAHRRRDGPDHRTAGPASRAAVRPRPRRRDPRHPAVRGRLPQGRRRSRDHAPGQPEASRRGVGRDHRAAARPRHPGPDRRGGTQRLRVRDRGRPRVEGRRAALAGPVRPLPRQHPRHQRADVHQRADPAQGRRRGHPRVPRRPGPGDRPVGHRRVEQP